MHVVLCIRCESILVSSRELHYWVSNEWNVSSLSCAASSACSDDEKGRWWHGVRLWQPLPIVVAYLRHSWCLFAKVLVTSYRRDIGGGWGKPQYLLISGASHTRYQAYLVRLCGSHRWTVSVGNEFGPIQALAQGFPSWECLHMFRLCDENFLTPETY